MCDNAVMLSRSEASRGPLGQTLRFAQGDKRGADFKIRLILLICIIAHTADYGVLQNNPATCRCRFIGPPWMFRYPD